MGLLYPFSDPFGVLCPHTHLILAKFLIMRGAEFHRPGFAPFTSCVTLDKLENLHGSVSSSINYVHDRMEGKKKEKGLMGERWPHTHCHHSRFALGTLRAP